MKILKKIGRPIWRPFYQKWSQVQRAIKTYNLPINRILRGGENGIRAAKYSELTHDFLRPSTRVIEGPHVKFLQLYDKVGMEIFDDENFKSTEYFKNAMTCMHYTGSYFYDRETKIKTLAQRFVAQYEGKSLNEHKQPGQSDIGQPIWVRPIKYSSCYELIDGNHRVARAIMNGKKSIKAFIYESEPVLTPLQQLLLDCLWINKKRWLYQPVDFPELSDKWTLIRKCDDRLLMMMKFLSSDYLNLEERNYLDIGSSYGWFVKKFSEGGFQAIGLERDPFGMDIGFKVYGLNPSQIVHSDIGLGLERLLNQGKVFSVISCLSVLHHFVLKKSSLSAEDFIRLVCKLTRSVLFLDTGEASEFAFGTSLDGWTPEFIASWIKKHTRFKQVIPLGKDDDRHPPFQGYYNRTLFACVK